MKKQPRTKDGRSDRCRIISRRENGEISHKNSAYLGVKVVVSNHDFEKTPSKEEIVARLQKMQELGADLPQDRSDAAVQERCADNCLRQRKRWQEPMPIAPSSRCLWQKME